MGEEQLDLIQGLQDKIIQAFSLTDCLFYASVPVTKHTIKKNNRPIFKNRKTGAPMIGKSKDLRAAEDHLLLAFKSAYNKLHMTKPIDGPIWCIFLFYYTREQFFTKEGHPSIYRGDLSNLYSLPEDSLQQAGVIEDDNQICSHDLSRRLVGRETKLEVFILRHRFEWRNEL